MNHSSESLQSPPAYLRQGAFFILITIVFFGQCAAGNQIINLAAVKTIESGGNPQAVSSAGAVGLYQIMPVVRKSYNQRTNHNVKRSGLFDAKTNTKIAKWYLETRIPQMLRYYGLKVNTKNILWSYNAGIGRCLDRVLPEETSNYLEKYRDLVSP